MANIPNEYDFHRDTVDKWNIMKDEHRDAPKAKAVVNVDEFGNQYNDLNPMPVKADLEASDIQIGAVEIKDGSTNNRAIVTPQGELKVALGAQAATTTNDEFGKSTIAPSASATLVSYTVPTAKTYGFAGVILTGEEYGYFEVLVNSVVRTTWRNSGSKRSSNIPFPALIEMVAGDTVEIKATNNGVDAKDFEASVFGTLREV